MSQVQKMSNRVGTSAPGLFLKKNPQKETTVSTTEFDRELNNDTTTL